MFGKMRKSLGSKRKELRPEDIATIAQLYVDQVNNPGTVEAPALSKVFNGTDFGYSTITPAARPRVRVLVTLGCGSVGNSGEAWVHKSVSNVTYPFWMPTSCSTVKRVHNPGCEALTQFGCISDCPKSGRRCTSAKDGSSGDGTRCSDLRGISGHASRSNT